MAVLIIRKIFCLSYVFQLSTLKEYGTEEKCRLTKLWQILIITLWGNLQLPILHLLCNKVNTQTNVKTFTLNILLEHNLNVSTEYWYNKNVLKSLFSNAKIYLHYYTEILSTIKFDQLKLNELYWFWVWLKEGREKATYPRTTSIFMEQLEKLERNVKLSTIWIYKFEHLRLNGL